MINMQKYEFSTVINKISCGKNVNKIHTQLKTRVFVENFYETENFKHIINIKFKHKYAKILTCNNYQQLWKSKTLPVRTTCGKQCCLPWKDSCHFREKRGKTHETILSTFI